MQSKNEIISEIKQLYSEGEPLNYREAERKHLGLVRRATRVCGSWSQAIDAAGIDYDKVRKYQHWNKERVTKRIRWWHRKGADLSWSHVSKSLDPALGAAALRPKQFGSWAAAIEAAGLDYRKVSRYRRWNREEVIKRISYRKAKGLSLHVGNVISEEPTLVFAARRWFQEWTDAVMASANGEEDINLAFIESLR